MDTNASLLLLIADLNSQIHALQGQVAALSERLADAEQPGPAA